jgi:hypothetical protein
MTGSIKHRFRQVKRWPSWLFWPLVLAMRAYFLLLRKEIRDPHGCRDLARFPWITVTWHNRLLYFPLMFSRPVRMRTAAMISASRDGQYLADLIGFFGLRTVRGSSSRKGAAALRGALAELRRGNTVSITPDGPRGPCHRMSLGPVMLASQTGFHVLPIAVNYSSHWCLRSWDRFQIPKPFAKVTLIIGEPVAIPPALGDADMEPWRSLLEVRLNEISGVGEKA